MQLQNKCLSNSQVFAQGKVKCNFDCYKDNYSLVALKNVQLLTNNCSTTYDTLLLSLGSLCIPIEAHLLILLLLYSSGMCSSIIDIHLF